MHDPKLLRTKTNPNFSRLVRCCRTKSSATCPETAATSELSVYKQDMATSEEDVLFTAMRSGDPRFDGKFFIAVKTTKIYCRPICPARPRRRNIIFFANALAAEKAGFRPCLRCRPESAPQSAAWQGTSAIVNRGLQRLFSCPDDTYDENNFAASLGVGPRHLRRLFVDEIGKTPKQIFDMRRLDFARKLVVETSLPINHIAEAIGLSVRRFNDAFACRFRRPPSLLRKTQSRTASSSIMLQLAYRPPLHWEAMLHWLDMHAMSSIEQVDHQSYQRVFRCGQAIAAMRVFPSQRPHHLEVELTNVPGGQLLRTVHRIRQMFDLDSDPQIIEGHLAAHSQLMAKLINKHPGLRVAHGWDGFEVGVCAILGQLVSTRQAKRLVAQLIEQCGELAVNPLNGEPCHVFPTPAKLAQSTLKTLATSESRRHSIRMFASAVASGQLTLQPQQDANQLNKSLRALPGIGAWTAQYIAMRTLHDCNAFPSTDLILARVVKSQPELDISKLQPWRSYAAVYLWREFAGQPTIPANVTGKTQMSSQQHPGCK
jgi:AraC family transcriptional regulator, regulatory protein of adaptative response / DNA-3-methyladenine glycosylase II